MREPVSKRQNDSNKMNDVMCKKSRDGTQLKLDNLRVNFECARGANNQTNRLE